MSSTESRIRSWGMIHESVVELVRPSTTAELEAAFAAARERGTTVTMRGGGNSYGDLPLNDGGIVLDMSGLDRILDWDPATGIARVQPGVTIEKLWRHVIGDGYWPAVVPGTMKVTIGGACGLDIHGKNHFAAGSFRDHVLAFELLTPGGDRIECSTDSNPDVFTGAIGSFGMLGCFTEITLKLKRVSSGRVLVEPISVESFEHMARVMESHEHDSDYLVGWHDGLVGGESLGRGLIHRAIHPETDDDPCFEVARQELPRTLFGVFPRSFIWPGLWCFLNDPGMRIVNFAKYLSGRMAERRGSHLQPLAAFHFLLDYVPNWKFSYRPGGLIQFQSFVPRAEAPRVFGELVEHCRACGHPPYLVVTKRHRETASLVPYSVDGYSQALDIRVTPRNRASVERMVRELEEIVFRASGRFYLAKDGMMTADSFRRFVAADRLAAFLAMKRRLDPEGILESDLARRLALDVDDSGGTPETSS